MKTIAHRPLAGLVLLFGLIGCADQPKVAGDLDDFDSETASAAKVRVLLDKLSAPSFLKVAGDRVFVSDQDPAAGLVLSVGTGGGEVRTVSSKAGGRPGPLAVSDNNVYWPDLNAKVIVQANRFDGPPGAVAFQQGDINSIAVVTGVADDGAGNLVDVTKLIWANELGLRAAAIDEATGKLGPIEEQLLDDPPVLMAADRDGNGVVFVTASGALRSRRTRGCADPDACTAALADAYGQGVLAQGAARGIAAASAGDDVIVGLTEDAAAGGESGLVRVFESRARGAADLSFQRWQSAPRGIVDARSRGGYGDGSSAGFFFADESKGQIRNTLGEATIRKQNKPTAVDADDANVYWINAGDRTVAKARR